jgi:cellulose synthase/poly-beta-1,6-N-acetylglucosamine synthase-like glycosyltransferase
MGTALTHLALFVLAVPAVLACAYLLVLTLLSARMPVPSAAINRWCFDIVVPAHDESRVIGRTIAGFRNLEWPADQFRVLVVADNCSDDTAAVARAAGVTVLERHDAERRGKGYALAFAFDRSRDDARADAVVVVDADSVVSPNFLAAIAARLDRGERAVQVHYGVLNPGASWRTRLLTIAQAAFHIVRSRARERLGVSCGIRGNGWCVTHEVLAAVPYGAYSLTEDIEYGIALGVAGVRVAYADEADCDAEMVTGELASGRQRQRWEHGRFQLIRAKALWLLGTGLRERSALCLDLALDLLVLPLSFVVLNVAALAGLAALAGMPGWLRVAGGCTLALLTYVLRGWQLSDIGLRGVLDLGRAPFFLAWKIILMLRPHDAREWVRTDREEP